MEKDGQSAGQRPRQRYVCTRAQMRAHSFLIFDFGPFRAQEGQSGHQKEVLRHHQAAKEGEER